MSKMSDFFVCVPSGAGQVTYSVLLSFFLKKRFWILRLNQNTKILSY